MKHILVTGSDGFIGSHLVEELVKKGKNVKAFCNYNSFGKHGWIETIDKKVVKDIEIISGDVRDPWCIQKNMKGCDKVFAGCYSINYPAIYNFQKQNWVVEGILKSHRIVDGKTVDFIQWAIFKDVWCKDG